jgi:NAD(P)H dehydrogenase (quinone)
MAAKKILILNGHPDKESYNYALAEAYFKGAKASGADVQIIHIRDLHFNLNLQYGYRKRTDLEPDLLMTQEKLKWAEHLVLVYPVWWGSVPAIMKGFLDRTLLPGFAFQKRENSVWWDTLFDTKNSEALYIWAFVKFGQQIANIKLIKQVKTLHKEKKNLC